MEIGTKQERSFLEMGNGCPNVKNVFEGSSLTDHRGYLESWWIFITFFNILSLYYSI